MLGDCIDLFVTIDDNSIDLVITDPPYGVDFKADYDDSPTHVFSIHEEWVNLIQTKLKPHSHAYFFIPTTEVEKWVIAVKKYLNLNNILATQVYLNKTLAKNNFKFDLQLILYASKGKAKNFNKVNWIKKSDVWLDDKRNPDKNPYTYFYPSFISNNIVRANTKSNQQIKRLHPNQKSTKLIKDLIRISSNKGDIVLDPFCGSGSTCVSAAQLKRKFIGFEKQEKYWRIACERVKKYTQTKSLMKY